MISSLDPKPHIVLVALDGSAVAEEALPAALAQATTFNAELRLLRVVPSSALARPIVAAASALTEPDIVPEPDEPEREEERLAREYLEALADNLRARGAMVTSKVRKGPIVSTIVDEAKHVDLLVLANHGAGRLARFVVGSVATQLLAITPCPTLLVPVAPLKPDLEAPVRSFSDVADRYSALMQRPLGIRTVPLERIVGSVGRAAELRADFMPRKRPQGDARFKRILKAMEDGAVMPPVDLYKLGYDYYVLDGHHRVAAARKLGQLDIDAVVTEFIPVENQDMQRVFVERRDFERATGLTRIGAVRPSHYERLEEMIREYAERHEIPDLKDAALRWYTEVYLPMAARIRAARLNSSFPGERTADLVVHVEDLRREYQRVTGAAVSWEEALRWLVARYRSSRRAARLRLPNLRQLLARI
jgi:nucleotide-binding universal stress UspA family protein